MPTEIATLRLAMTNKKKAAMTPLQGNPKLKALNPKQIPVSKFKVQNRLGHLDFGHLILFSISDLVFGILPFALSFCPLIFDIVVAQFIGQLCLMNQATTKPRGEAAQSHAPPRLPRLRLAMTIKGGQWHHLFVVARHTSAEAISELKSQCRNYQPSASFCILIFFEVSPIYLN